MSPADRLRFRIFASRTVCAVLFVLGLAGAPARALDYVCPVNPRECFEDVGHDGCFDPGIDDATIRPLLQATLYVPANGGSVVCPPGTSPLRVPDGTTWQVPGRIVLHGVRLEDAAHTPWPLTADVITLEAADRVFVQGLIAAEKRGGVRLLGQNGVELAAKASLRVTPSSDAGFGSLTVELVAAAGDVVVGARARLNAPRVRIQAAGDVTLGDRVRLDYQAFSGNEIVAGGDLRLGSPRIKGKADLRLAGANVSGEHPSIVIGTRRTEIVAAPGGAVELASLQSKDDQLAVSAGSVTIGIPDPVTGRLARSAVTGRTTIDATGPVRIRNVRFTGPTFAWVTVDVHTTGDEIRFTGNTVQGRKGSPPGIVLAADGAGSLCDLTGTVLAANGSLTTACATVIGP